MDGVTLTPTAYAAPSAPTTRTTQPIVTGASVLAVKYRDGILFAADTMGSYGRLGRFKDIRRLRGFGPSTLVGFSGDFSDFQAITDLLEDKLRQDKCIADGRTMSAKEIHSYLSRLLYDRRSRFNPLWNSLVVGGLQRDGSSFLGVVDMLGASYEENYLATGFGAYMALPMMRARWVPDMEEAEARTLLEDCMRVLVYRDCYSLNRLTLGKMTAAGPSVSEPYSLETKWDYKHFVAPKAGPESAGSW